MPSQILVRGLDPDVVERLRRRAERNHRSLEAEVRTILEDAAIRERNRIAAREIAARFQEELRGRPQTDSAELIREDRDSR